MSARELLPLAVLLTSLVAGLAIFPLAENQQRTRTAFNVAAAVVKIALIVVIGHGVLAGEIYETRLPFLPGADLVLRADSLSLLFVSLSGALWLVTTIYAVGYLEGSAHRSRFFGFFSLSVASTMGVALAGNLATFFVFYELLTLSTYPLVVHRGTPEALRAGDRYLRYTITGGVVLLAGVVLLYALLGEVEFIAGGVVQGHDISRPTLIAILAFLIGGLGVKAALIPVHTWLPVAMVAPAPVSALLHAVAVVKAGAFGITRVVYDVYGIALTDALGIARVLAVLATVTIIFGSLKAMGQDDLKRRLAYSTISQVSFIILGVAVVGKLLTVGGIAHLVHQGLMKITLFFCAGNLAEELGVHQVKDMRGAGRRMPLTMAAFTLASLGMIGVPPLAGFITKWYLGAGAVDAGAFWVIPVLIASSVLNAAYLLPLVYDAWFREPSEPWPPRRHRFEIDAWLLVPTLVTAAAALAVGLFAGMTVSPLALARLIADRELGP